MWGSAGGKADRLYVTRTDSGEREEYTLTDDRELVFTGNGYTLHVRISDGGVCVESSDCPGCDCVRTGRITEPGRSIVCIPAGLVFTLGGEEDADAVAG
ncbi:MAG: NusG domain II-containing protein [Clostridia bacterium]|nr:NusG domain II-containing protein [Clostridia bacterium]